MFERGRVTRDHRIRHAHPALVEPDQPGERRQPVEEPGDDRVQRRRHQTGDRPWHADEIDRSTAADLVGDRHASTSVYRTSGNAPLSIVDCRASHPGSHRPEARWPTFGADLRAQRAPARTASASSALIGGPIGVRSWPAATRASSSGGGRSVDRATPAPRAGDADVPDQVAERGVVVHEQDARRSVTDDPEGVRHTTRHRHPMSGTDDRHLVPATHDHLAFEDVPRVVEVVVYVQRCRRADRQRHLQHDRLHARCTPMLDDKKIEEPPRRCQVTARVINHCCGHLTPTFIEVRSELLAPAHRLPGSSQRSSCPTTRSYGKNQARIAKPSRQHRKPRAGLP